MSTLKLSITPQLRELLEPLQGLLPPELNGVVVDTLATNQILYNIVVDVSKWAFTDEGKVQLEEKGLSELKISVFRDIYIPFYFTLLFFCYKASY